MSNQSSGLPTDRRQQPLLYTDSVSLGLQVRKSELLRRRTTWSAVGKTESLQAGEPLLPREQAERQLR
jgi:hypothetical protein